MANPPSGGGGLNKQGVDQGLGRSTLINPTLTIPMPAGAAPAAGSQGQSGGGDSSQTAQGSKSGG
jgi:hypothetical protein